VVGSGAEESRLRNMAIQMQMSSQIVFHGKKKRNEVQQIVEQSDCFVMVSYREAFGLVYLEAMAKGCITVGLKGQGIDGVIIDGVNGFLCATDQVEDLADVLKKIRSLHTDQLQSISQKARETVMNLTDENAAEHYLNSIL
jgi:glycosyltransferase involved in cell wall biosynthesis